MKVKVRNAHDGHGLIFTLDMISETDEDKRVMDFFRERVEPIAKHQQDDKFGRSFLYAYEIICDSFVSMSFSEQGEHNVALESGRKIKAIEIEV